ncbi:MAG: hypothetical protein IJW21_03535 [Clostridia bacterium]|nr:hypothetical protein [Clostridia bacterium]
MRVYIPPKNKKTMLCSFLGIMCGSLLFLTSYFAVSFRGLIQLCAFGFWGFGFWVVCRYMLVSYYYVLDGDNFHVIKVIGHEHRDACNINMRTGKFIKKLSEAKGRPPARERFNYCRNFVTAQRYVYFFEWNGVDAEIIFESNAEFAALMAEKLETLRSFPCEEPADAGTTNKHRRK